MARVPDLNKPYVVEGDIFLTSCMGAYLTINQVYIDKDGFFNLNSDAFPFKLTLSDFLREESSFNQDYIHLSYTELNKDDLVMDIVKARPCLVTSRVGDRCEVRTNILASMGCQETIWIDKKDINFLKVLNRYKGPKDLIVTSEHYNRLFFNISKEEYNNTKKCPKCNSIDLEYFRTADKCKRCGYVWY